MWICSTLGFFSIVKKQSAWQVRARDSRDLVRLIAGVGLGAHPIITTPDADYRWRIVVNKRQLDRILITLGDSIEYPNFKSQIAGDLGQASKLGAYHAFWHDLCQVQDRIEGKSQMI
jgi:hypothetical protein